MTDMTANAKTTNAKTAAAKNAAAKTDATKAAATKTVAERVDSAPSVLADPSVAGMTKNDAVTMLIRDHGYNMKSAAAYFTANKSGGGGVSYASFIARCVEAPFSKEEFEEYSEGWARSAKKNPRFEIVRAGFQTLRANLSK